MRSLSDILIKKREERGLTISQVSYETNISQKYLVALEEEDFDIFPAEAYLLGFLRNYAEFLGLEYQDVIAEYKNCIVREEPTPLSELMGMKKTFVFKPWMVIVTVFILSIIFGVPPMLKGIKSQIERRKEILRLSHEEKSKNFQVDEDYSGKKIKESDTLALMVGDDKLIYKVQHIGSDVSILESFKGNDNLIILKLGNEEEFKFSDKSGKEYFVTIFLKDIGGFSDNSAIIKIRRDIKALELFQVEQESNVESKTANTIKVLMVRKRSPIQYTISIRFDGDILFRYQQKGKQLKEAFYKMGSILNLDVTRSIRIWTSNAGLTKFELNGDKMVLGRTGQVHVFDLRWIYVKDKDEYRLEYENAY